MFWVHLSPHFDDIALSCGGLAWQQSQTGETVQIWTICAGDPPQGKFSPFAEGIHTRWGTGPEATQARRAEDLASCALLGATPRHFSIPDCIYRTDPNGVHLYASEAALFSPVHPAEDSLIEQVAGELSQLLPSQVNLVSPVSVGQHVDHRLTRRVAERVAASRTDCTLWYYVDFPYVLTRPQQFSRLRGATWESVLFPLNEPAIRAWTNGFTAHASQLSTFWPDADTAQAVFDTYSQLMGGVRLWKVKRDTCCVERVP
jgi:LmbE family N-acetylglucosaminyl deacetylase